MVDGFLFKELVWGNVGIEGFFCKEFNVGIEDLVFKVGIEGLDCNVGIEGLDCNVGIEDFFCKVLNDGIEGFLGKLE